MIMLDTHIAVALYEGRVSGLSARAKRALNREPATISPAVLLELELLHEIGRLRFGGKLISQYLSSQLGIELAHEKLSEVAEAALALVFTRDPFDRLIVAHALVKKSPLVTLDKRIQANYARAFD